MRFLILIAGLFISLSLFSQEADDRLNPRDEPYPAPVMYNNVTQMEAAFIKLFDDREVTNMHFYAAEKARPSDDYYYKGTPVFPNLKKFLPGGLQSQTYIQNYEPHAVLSMRGEGEELYILRFPGKASQNRLILFDMENDQLGEKMVLAYYDCNSRGRCVQQDSWLQDLNGDTRIDIIQKKRIKKANGKTRTKVKIYTQDQQGNFRKANKVNIQEDDYRMQEIR